MPVRTPLALLSSMVTSWLALDDYQGGRRLQQLFMFVTAID